MKIRRISFFAIILLVLAGGVIWLKTSNRGKNPALLVTGPGKSAAGSRPEPERPNTKKSATPFHPQAPITPGSGLSTQQTETILEQINDASVTYDSRELSKIQPFLTHADPEVRKAAMNGMIVLGDASAGAMLRDAAKSAQSPQEAVAMLEAADYVELPSATNDLRNKIRKHAGKPRKNPGQVAKPEHLE